MNTFHRPATDKIAFSSDASGAPHQNQKRDASEVVVLYTGHPSTLAALRTASQLVHGLNIRIRLLALYCVPYPLPVDQPPIHVQFLEETFDSLAAQWRAADTRNDELTLTADLRLCRDRWEMLKHAAGAVPSVLVIARRPRWLGLFPRQEDWLARKLAKAGHHVVRTAFTKDPAQYTTPQMSCAHKEHK